MTKYSFAFVTLVVSSLSIATANGQGYLAEARFLELMASIVPAESSKLVDWHPDLLVAQKIALERKKPIFIWSMDGHPLGCT